jgi:hypothetical protein
MEVKLLELRDQGTFIPLFCVDMNVDAMIHTHWGIPGSRDDPDALENAQRYYLRRCGYPCDERPNIAITHLSANGDRFSNDPHYWGGRTFPVAHKYIIEHWDELRDGDVVDVQFILGETPTPKISERESVPL